MSIASSDVENVAAALRTGASLTADDYMELAGMSASARAIASAAASEFNISFDAALQQLLRIPDNAVAMYATPEGWSLLSQHLAMSLLGQPAFIKPVVH